MIDVVLAAEPDPNLALAAAAPAISAAAVMPLSAVDTLAQLDDKGRFAQLLAQLELPQPQAIVLRDAADMARIDFPYPIVLKPLRGHGGRGIQRIASRDELQAVVERVALPVLAQQFITGRDLCISVLAHDGRLLARTVQRRARRPARFEFLRDARLEQIATTLIAASGYEGVAHIDTRVDAATGAALVLDFNPRFWAPLGFSHWAGVNFPSLLFELARGWVPRDCEMFVAEPCAIRTTLPYAPVFGDGHGIGAARATRHAAMARSRTLLSDPVPNLVKLLGRYWRRAAPAVVAAAPRR